MSVIDLWMQYLKDQGYLIGNLLDRHRAFLKDNDLPMSDYPQVLPYVPPLIVNGGFDTDTAWTKNAGWTISGGVASRTNTGAVSTLVQTTPPLTPGTQYVVTWTLVSVTSGAIAPVVGGTTGTYRSAAGTYSQTLTATTSAFLMAPSSVFAGSIDNIIVEPA